MNNVLFLKIVCLSFLGLSSLDAKLELKELAIGKKIYKEAIVEREGAETIVISHEGGKARIPVSKLPKEIASQMGIDESLLSPEKEEEVFRIDKLTVKNRDYQEVVLKKVNEYEVALSHEGGKARVPLKDLPESLRQKLGYNEKLAYEEGKKLLKERQEAGLAIFEAAEQRKMENQFQKSLDEENQEGSFDSSSGNESQDYAQNRITIHRHPTESAVRASWRYPDLCFSSTEMYKLAKKLGVQASKDFFDDHNWPEKLAELTFKRMSPAPRFRQGEYNDWKKRPDNEYSAKYVFSNLCEDIVRAQNKKKK